MGGGPQDLGESHLALEGSWLRESVAQQVRKHTFPTLIPDTLYPKKGSKAHITQMKKPHIHPQT